MAKINCEGGAVQSGMEMSFILKFHFKLRNKSENINEAIESGSVRKVDTGTLGYKPKTGWCRGMQRFSMTENVSGK